MESFALQSGELPRQLKEKYGRELTINECIANTAYGIGFLNQRLNLSTHLVSGLT
ncbi:hypothetical protein [Fulvivirga sp. M361]|uniref:hypothetical protein n=1 Tax=Fulvivirga sp. M361 TaxID=2594266 RepID=UPI001625B94C|nr:hypothetical protein [Fulvivirga sp. M361]